MTKIVCIGSLNVDTQLFVDEFCGNDEEVAVRELTVSSGGQAGNIAAGLGRLGQNAIFFGNIGGDSYTPMLLSDLDASNVDYSFAKRIDFPNNTVMAIIDKSGERRLYAYNHVDFSADDFSDQLLEGAKFVVFTSLIKDDIIDTYVNIAKRAKGKGVKVAMDPGNILAKLGFDKLKPLLELCDYFFPSENEVELIVGADITKLTKIIPHLIVTCGKNGAHYYQNGGEAKVFPCIPVDVVDTTGAGDAFAAAFLAAMVEGKSEEDAINFANHAAALSITKKGARSMPTRQEVGVFIDERRNL